MIIEEQKKAIEQFFLKIIYFSRFTYRLCLESHFSVSCGAPEKSWKLCIIYLNLSGIINDQIMEVEAMLSVDCLQFGLEASVLEDIEWGKFVVVYASVESASDNRFLQSLKKNTTFNSSLVPCVVDDSHTVETWTCDAGQLQWETRNSRGPHTINAASDYKRSYQPETLTVM